MRKVSTQGGFTFIEMIVALTVILLLIMAAVPALFGGVGRGGRDAVDDARGIVHLLGTAQSNAVSNKNNDHWGVRVVDNGRTDCGDANEEKDCLVVYKGNEFENRDATYDQVFVLSGGNQWGKTRVIKDYTAVKDCGASAEVDGSGTIAWSNETSACGSDDTDATAAVTGTTDRSEYLKLTNFGFEIPSDATIDGIDVLIERAAPASCVIDYELFIVKDGTIGSTNRADVSTQYPASDFKVPYGGNTDLWGETWKPSDINSSSFGVALAAEQDGTSCSGDISVDNVSMRVWYTRGAPPVRDFYFNKFSGLTKNLKGLPADPYAYYSFENATSSDFSGNDNHLTATTTFPTATTSCSKWSDCFYIPGQNSAFNMPAMFDETYKDGHTVSAWIKATSTPAYQNMIMGSAQNGTWSYGTYFGLWTNSTGYLKGTTCAYNQPDGAGAVCTNTQGPVVIDDVWHNILFVVEPNNQVQKLYVDGELSEASLINDTADYYALTRNRVGRHIRDNEDGQYFWNGMIDDVSVFLRPLDPVEVKNLYEFSTQTSTASGLEPTPLYITSGYVTTTINLYSSGNATTQ